MDDSFILDDEIQGGLYEFLLTCCYDWVTKTTLIIQSTPTQGVKPVMFICHFLNINLASVTL